MKKMYIQQLREKDIASDFYAVAQCVRKTSSKGQTYLDVQFSDRTGRIIGRVWNNADRIAGVLVPGTIVRVEAVVDSYQGELQLNVSDARAVRPQDKVTLGDFLAKTPHDITDLYRQILEYKNSVAQPFARALLDTFFDDEEFAKQFRDQPAAKSMHHAYVGGLLEHTLSVARACDALAKQYDYLDRDLLVSGALIHDIGKMKELAAGLTIDYSIPGQLVGHISIGAEMVASAAAGIKGFPDQLKWQLQHFVLSHHGELEFGSPVRPATLEALVLHAVDNLDAKLFQARKAITEDTNRDAAFTPRIFGLDRAFYKPATQAPAGDAAAPVAPPPAPSKQELDLGTSSPAQESLL
ncbi:HD domain-containing protein [bacterium]|nr:HD domain-containing protein [bacterium]